MLLMYMKEMSLKHSFKRSSKSAFSRDKGRFVYGIIVSWIAGVH